jgi:hypothetical protein
MSGFGSVYGILFVFVAVIIVVIGGGATCWKAVEGKACEFGSRFSKKVDATEDGFARSFSGLNNEDRFVSVRGDD